MKSLIKPVKFNTVSPCIYGYEDEDETNDDGTPFNGSDWRTTTSRRGQNFVTVNTCVTTDYPPKRCTVGNAIVTWNF